MPVNPGDILERKGAYDELFGNFELLNEKRDEKHQEVLELERQKHVLAVAIKDRKQKLKQKKNNIARLLRERDRTDRLLDNLTAGGARARLAMCGLQWDSISPDQRARIFRQKLQAQVMVDPSSPKLGRSATMHHAAVQVSNLTAPLSDGRRVPLRCYSGSETDGPTMNAAALPVVVYFHGEGYVSGNLDTHDWVCRSLSALAGVTVIAVDYRRAPEHRFPAAFEDAYGVLSWISAGGLGLRPPRLGVAGDSTGAGLAAACCLAAAQRKSSGSE